MNTLQRQFGKLTIKGAGNDAKISVILQDFDEADKMLTKIIDASNAWRDAWISILNVQLSMMTAFDELYNPIIGATADGYGHPPVITPPEQIERAFKLKVAYGELKTDLLEEVNMMDARVLRPATDAKDSIQPMKKTIKKRDNKRLDYERYQDRVNHAQKKMKRTDRENSALAKFEEDLTNAGDDFKTADAHLKETLPPIIAAVFSLLPHLLAAQIMIQNNLLAQSYTILHNYCQEQGFQSPPPPMEEVIAQWEQDFKPIQRQAEATKMIARGKAIHAPMQLGEEGGRKGSSVTGLGIRNQINARRGSSQQMTSSGASSPAIRPEPRTNRIPSSNSIPSTVAVISPQESYSVESDYDDRSASPYTTAHSPAGPVRDYFSRDRQVSNGGTPSSLLSPAASVVGKKKPPPPPPKRLLSGNMGVFVTAIYTFDGQQTGDLSFREGDRIKVLKKTESSDDWWEGELKGQTGKFPANYCQVA